MGQVLRIAMRRLGWAAPVAAVVIAREESRSRNPRSPGTRGGPAAHRARRPLPVQGISSSAGERRYARQARGNSDRASRIPRRARRPEIAPQMIGAKAGVRDDRRETAGVVAVGGGIRVVHQPRVQRGDERRVSGWQHCRRGRWRERCDLGRRQVRKLPRQQAGQLTTRQAEQHEFVAARACRNECAEQACIGCIGTGRRGQQRLQRPLPSVIERGCHRTHPTGGRTARFV